MTKNRSRTNVLAGAAALALGLLPLCARAQAAAPAAKAPVAPLPHPQKDPSELAREEANSFFQAVAPAVRPASSADLADLAQKACAKPGSVAQSDIDIVGWFPNPDAQAAVSLSGCAKDLYEELAALNSAQPADKIPLAWLNARAAVLRARYSVPAAAPKSRTPGPRKG